MFTPAELPIDDAADVRHRRGDDPHGPSGADGDGVPCVAALPAGWSVGGVCVRRSEARFWLDSDQAGGHAVEVTPAPAAARARSTGRPRCPATSRACAGSSEPDAAAPRLRAVRTYLSDGECVTYRFEFDGDGQRVVDRGPRRRPVVPAPRRARRRGRATVRAALCAAPARRRARGRRVMRSCWRRSLGVVAPRGRRRIVLAVVITCVSLRLLGHAARVGHRPARRRRRLGRSRSSSRSVSTAGIGVPTASCCTSSPSASWRRWPPRSRWICSLGPGSLAIGERAGLVVIPARCAPSARRVAVFRRYRELVRIARRRRVRPDAIGRPRRTPRQPWACGCAACSRRRAASTSSLVRSPPRESICSRPTSAPSWRRCRTGSRPSRAMASQPS